MPGTLNGLIKLHFRLYRFYGHPDPTALSLAALGHEARLGVFRLLVRAGNDGLTVGEIGQHMEMAASTLAHHLRALADAGLVLQTRQGREIRNRVDYDQMRQTIDFLTSECCAGVKLVPVKVSA